jgi:1,4-dihydroxy-2-naphthoyl-CoA hydrolase
MAVTARKEAVLSFPDPLSFARKAFPMIDPNTPIDSLNATSKDTMVEHLGIEYTEVGAEHLCARMPVDHRTVQPHKVLHGGASVALAETVGSFASALMIDRERYTVRGLNISANHVGTAEEGYVHARAELLHGGRSTHVWDIRISREDGRTVCLCRLTNMVLALSP